MGIIFKGEIHIPYFQNILVYFSVKSTYNIDLFTNWSDCQEILAY